jgi:hypothetical protein
MPPEKEQRQYNEDTVALEYIAVYIGIPKYGHPNCLKKGDPDLGEINVSRLVEVTDARADIEIKHCCICGKKLFP